MRKTKIAVILAVLGATAALLLALYLWPPRCPLELSFVRAEPSAMIYFGEKKAVVVTLKAKNADIVDVLYEMPSFEANVDGRWVKYETPQQFPFTDAHLPPWASGMRRVSTGTSQEEKLVMPGDVRVCRAKLRYFSDTWKARLNVRIGSNGRNWVAKSRWLSKWLAPEPFGGIPMQPWKVTAIEVVIPRN